MQRIEKNDGPLFMEHALPFLQLVTLERGGETSNFRSFVFVTYVVCVVSPLS